jgi:hypothetical protein
MSDGGAGAGAGGDASYGHGGGFWQSPDAFSGLTNTDLRPRRRKRRPVPLLNTSWLIKPGTRRRKGDKMAKGTDHLTDDVFGLLEKSLIGIAAGGAENQETLLHQTLSEFRDALMEKLEPFFISGATEETLEKGLNHVSMFANALRDLDRTVQAIKTGRPSWMSNSDGMAPEEVSDGAKSKMDLFLRLGVTTLQSMVNDTAEELDEQDDLERAEAAGELHKIECYDGFDLMVKTALPPAYREYLTDPVDLVADWAEGARALTNMALEMAEPMIKMGALPAAIVEEYPELFEKAEDETLGTGADPDDASDPGDPGADPGDAPQDPIEMITRLASIIVVVAGSLQQGAGADPTDDPTDPNSADNTAGMPNDNSGTQPLQRQARGFDIGDTPLAKIYSGEVAVHPTVADALEKLAKLEKDAAKFTEAESQLGLLRATVTRLQKMPAPPKGALFAVNKGNDVVIEGQATNRVEEEQQRIEALAKSNPEAAAKEMLKIVHLGGGTPIVPPSIGAR